MRNVKKNLHRTVLLACLCLVTFSGTGCTLASGFMKNMVMYCWFWEVLPPVPVSAWQSQRVEDAYHEEERYDRVPVLDPVEGEHAPLFCLDPPTPDEVMRALPDDTAGGFPFLAESFRSNVRITTELIVDRVDPIRFYPQVGPARLHHCHYKCTVYYDKTLRSTWPIPFTHTDQTQEVVYIDHDHLIRAAGPPSD